MCFNTKESVIVPSASTKLMVCSVTPLSAGSKRVSSQSKRRESVLLVTLAVHLSRRQSAQ
jgi:hypothetical protein